MTGVDGPIWDDDECPQPGEMNGTGYPAATRDQLQRAQVSSAGQGLVRELSADDFFAPDDAADLVVPKLGIAAGPPTGFVGQAYVGKTIIALSTGLAIATEKQPLWGAFDVRHGAWLHLDYEQGRRHTKSRIRRLARGVGIGDEQLRAMLVSRQIRVAVFPDLRLTTDRAADQFRRLFEGVSLVTCDSLRPMLGGLDENSSQVRGYMSALSSASDATRAAVVLIIHAGKTPSEGKTYRPRKEMARGSSGIIDELQSMFVLTKAKGDAISLVTHEKDRELGLTIEDFGLRIVDVPATEAGDDPKWGLHVEHVDRAEICAVSDTVSLARAKGIVRDVIARHGGIAGNDAVRQEARIGRTAVKAAVDQLVAEGIVVKRKGHGKGNSFRLYLAEYAPPE